MRLFITGICGFVGSELACRLLDERPDLEIVGIDNLSRRGSERNLARLEARDIRVMHGDIRSASDLENVPKCDFVIDAAANPSVLAGIDGQSSSRQLVEHNLIGTIHLLEYCKRWSAGLILLSTSRVYSIAPLAGLTVAQENGAFRPVPDQSWPAGLSEHGIAETFSTAPPISLYGATKVASETLALEYGMAFDFPVFVNRCGVMAGAGQFGKADQGIFSYWIRSYREGKPLKYIGFGGTGAQVRDLFHPQDLAVLLLRQLAQPERWRERPVVNVGGGTENAMSLRHLTAWCEQRFGPRTIESDATPRPYDLPWIVIDARVAGEIWQWKPEVSFEAILEEIASEAPLP